MIMTMLRLIKISSYVKLIMKGEENENMEFDNCRDVSVNGYRCIKNEGKRKL